MVRRSLTAIKGENMTEYEEAAKNRAIEAFKALAASWNTQDEILSASYVLLNISVMLIRGIEGNDAIEEILHNCIEDKSILVPTPRTVN